MFNRTEIVIDNKFQKSILAILLEKQSIRQKDLAKELEISGAGLLYHLNKLKKMGLIEKKTVENVGNVKLNEITLNPNAIQRTRNILGLRQNKFTLITGFGKDWNVEEPSYLIPIKAKKLLRAEGYDISRMIALVTPQSNVQDAKKMENFIEKNFDYFDYRNMDADLWEKIEKLIQFEQKEAELILDLTPLTKLLTIKLLGFCYKYKIPSFYLGKTHNGADKLLWIYQPEKDIKQTRK